MQIAHGHARPERGFTLVELLVATAIIAILTSLLIPGVNALYRKANAAACMTNMRSVGSVILEYAADHDGNFPAPTTTFTSVGWVNATLPYIQSDALQSQTAQRAALKTYCCPTQRRTVTILSHGAVGANKSNFAINYALGPNSLSAAWHTMGQIHNAGQTIMLSEAGFTGRGSALGLVGALDTYWITQTATDANGNAQSGIHSGGNNVLWCDGHLSWWPNISTLGAYPYKPGAPQDAWTGGMN